MSESIFNNPLCISRIRDILWIEIVILKKDIVLYYQEFNSS